MASYQKYLELAIAPDVKASALEFENKYIYLKRYLTPNSTIDQFRNSVRNELYQFARQIFNDLDRLVTATDASSNFIPNTAEVAFARSMTGDVHTRILNKIHEPLRLLCSAYSFSFFTSGNSKAGDPEKLQGVTRLLRAFVSVTFKIEFENDPNCIHIDGLQLFKQEFGERYTYYQDGNVKTVRDALGQETKYSYTANDPTLIELPGNRKVVQTFNNHNVTSSKEQYLQNGYTYTTAVQRYTYDSYGNVIRSYSESSGVVSETRATYSSDGNYLAYTTDELGNQTTYEYDSNTGVLKSLQQPEDDVGTRTYYEYDEMFRLKKTSSTTDQGKTMSSAYTYTNDMLTQIKTPSTTYSMAYGDMALRTGVSIGGTALATYYYTHDASDRDKIDADKLLKQLDYGNGDKVKYYYDDLGRITQEVYYENGSTTASRTVTYAYDNSGALATMVDSKTGRTTKYYYDTVGRISSQYDTDSSNEHRIGYSYDSLGNVSTVTDTYNGSIRLTTYEYDGNNRVYKLSSGRSSEYYFYDSFNRLDERYVYHEGGWVLRKNIAYEAPTDRATSNNISVWSVTSPNTSGYGITYNISYDGNGNITSVKYGSCTTSYVYDSANQLIRENNQEAEKTWTWTYDAAGNITSKKEYAYTTGTLGTATDTITYTYGNSAWGDLLTAYDGQTLYYDAIGNLTGDANWNYSWAQGRQLSSMYRGSNFWNFTYDANGMRTGRSSASASYTYVYNGSQLSRMTYGSNTLLFTYGADGSPMTVTYNGTPYYYVVNLQGDVVAILNSVGTQVVGYTYDAWGRLLSTTGMMASSLGQYNPLRYRGYVYDRETGLYYVSSRYYDPEIGRFINADDIEYLGTDGSPLSYNLFAYCMNNPVNRFDVNGNCSLPNWAKIAIGAAAIAVGVIATAATGGAAAPVLVASLKIAATSAAIGAVSGAGISAVNHRVSTGSWEGAGKAAVTGAIDGACDGFMWGGITAGASFTTVAAKGIKVKEIGKLKPSNKPGDGYSGVKYQAPKANGKYTTRSIELHSPHKSGPHNVWHWQQNTWNPYNNSITGSAKHWTIWGKPL